MTAIRDELDKLLNIRSDLALERESTEFDRIATPFEKSLVLVGAGKLGKQVLDCLRREGIEPLAFADARADLLGQTVDGVPVLTRKEAAEKYGSCAAFVVTIWNAKDSYLSTRKELINLGCATVLSAIPLRWKFADTLLPYFWLDLPSRTTREEVHIKATFSLWADECSEREYINQLRFRLLADFDAIAATEYSESYFQDDLFLPSNNEQFVDCGAFNGITIRQFLDRQEHFVGEIIAYEPDPTNRTALEQYLLTKDPKESDRIVVLPWAVGEKRGIVRFDAMGTMGSTMSAEGCIEVGCVTLDESLKEIGIVPSFIKMDIEGAEFEALVGAKTTIQASKPILAVCLYHKFDDLWRIPALIHSLSDDYRLFLRAHEMEGWQLVCYAVPLDRLLKRR